MPKREGVITIKTGNKVISQKNVISQYQIPYGKYVLFSIADTGIGMNKETIKQIFKPSFSTKGMGRMHGWGLTIVDRIVKSHNGFIGVDSQKNKGSCFKIYFPALEKQSIEKSNYPTA